jgi:DNA-binding winged helix-turn-helix (wHTH) protein/TolB-like protein
MMQADESTKSRGNMLVRMKKRKLDSPGPAVPAIQALCQMGAQSQLVDSETVPNEERRFLFGPFKLEPDGVLFRAEAVVHLPPKELAALRLLIAHAGQIVSGETLRIALWGDVHVSADSVPRCLSSLRARLEPEKCIQTVYKRGYRLSEPVRSEFPSLRHVLPRLVVLPFAPGPNVPAHLGSAIAEETIVHLIGAQPPFVSVLARDSAFNLAAEGMTAHRIGQMLKSDLVLTGTLRALPSHYRLRAEMIRVEDGSQIWVEDLLIARERSAAMESELAERLCFRLQAGAAIDASRAVPVSSAAGLNIAAQGAEPVSASDQREAFSLYQAARYEWQAVERHRMQDAMQRLLRATELDPFLMAAKVELARVSVAQAYYGFVSPAFAADCVRQLVDSIPDFPNGAEAILPSLGILRLLVDRDLAAADSAFSRSAHLPHETWTTFARTLFATSRHHFEEAIGILENAIEGDPYAPWLHARLAWNLHLSGRHAKSLEKIRFCMKNFPGHESSAIYGAMILPFNGDAKAGLQLAESLSERAPHCDFSTALHAYALACAGRKDEAFERLQRLQWLSRERFVSPSFNPAIFVALGDHQAALAELRSAEQTRCPWFFQMLADPRLTPLHQYPQFQEMRAVLTRMEAEPA